LQVVERYRAGGARIVVPTYRGIRGHPVLFERSVFGELRGMTGDHGARTVTDRDPTRLAIVDIEDAKPIDVDTPADLLRLRAGKPNGRTLLDEFMPQFDVRASYATNVRAPAAVVYRAALETNLADSFIARTLMFMRSLGARSTGTFRIGELPLRGQFFELGRDPPREVVAGVVGRFWALTGNVCESDRESFRQPQAPGTAKAVWNFRVEETPTGARLSTETRVLCADAESRRQFRRYWTLVGPFSGLIRMDALRLIRNHAQYSSPSTTPTP
jgi:MobA-like NTP transferase protein